MKKLKDMFNNLASFYMVASNIAFIQGDYRMLKRIYFASIFGLALVLGGSPFHSVRAASDFWYSFDTVVNDPLHASTSGATGCPTMASDGSHYRFDLPVSDGLLAEMKAVHTAGDPPVIAFQTRTSIQVEPGNFTAEEPVAGYEANILIGIEGSDGAFRAIFSEQKAEVAASSKEMQEIFFVTLSQAMVNNVMPGDNIAMEATAQAIATAGDCEDSDGAATVEWQILGIDGDPDRPIVLGRFSATQ